jgi:1,6-anhydro-N-acetylmuramate kinase
MVYKVISLYCRGLHEGFNIVYTELQNQSGKWEYENIIKFNYNYQPDWKQKLAEIETKTVTEFTSIHNEFGVYLSTAIRDFIIQNNLEYRVQLISYKGFPVLDTGNFCVELGNPGFIAASSGINVVADFISINKALGGKGDFILSVPNELLHGADPEIQLALLAVLRWREENNFLAEKTGAARSSIGGAVWIGQEA